MALDEQSAEHPSVLSEAEVDYILGSVLWPRVRWAQARQLRLEALSLRARGVTLVIVIGVAGALVLGSTWWLGLAVLAALAAFGGYIVDRLIDRSDACLDSLAYSELWLCRVLTGTPLVMRHRADLLEYCDQNIDDLLYHSGLFDRHLPASVGASARHTIARELAVDDWRPRPWPPLAPVLTV